MGFTNDKLNATNSISQFDIMSTLPIGRVTSSIASVNSKSKNLLPFLLDMLNQIMKDNKPAVPSFSAPKVPSLGGGGKNGKNKINGLPASSDGKSLPSIFGGNNPPGGGGSRVKQILIEILLTFLPKLGRIIKEGIIKAMKASYSCNSNTRVPSTLPTVTVNVSDIDLTGMLKADPSSLSGGLMYGSDPSLDLNLFVSNVLQTPGTHKWKGLLDLSFDEPTNMLTISMNESYGGVLFDTFLTNFMDSITVIGVGGSDVSDQVSTLMNQVMENLFGTISSNMDISVDTLASLEETNMMMDKVFESDPCVDNFTVDNSFFDFSNEDLRTINDKAKARYQGYNTIDMGCGIATSSVSIEDLTQISNSIKGAKPTKINDVIEQSINTIGDIVALNADPSDKENVKLGFSTNFIKEIPKVFTGIIFTPKIQVMYNVVHEMFKGDGKGAVGDTSADVTTPSDFTFNNKVFFEYVGRESLAALLEILYDILKKEVIKLVTKLGIKIVKEKLALKLKAILSIISGKADGLLSSLPTP